MSLKNIFLGSIDEKTMQIKIGDFGMSIKHQDSAMKGKRIRRASLCGTHSFIAPEQYLQTVED